MSLSFTSLQLYPREICRCPIDYIPVVYSPYRLSYLASNCRIVGLFLNEQQTAKLWDGEHNEMCMDVKCGCEDACVTR
jgi:hypothetical protein